MISKLSSMSKSIFTKIILTVTALSFVSLFGVSGYITTANSNKAVIKVDDIEISQSEFSYALQREWAKLRIFLGDNLSDEAMEEKKDMLTADLAEMKLNNALLDNTMIKHNVDFTRNLISNIIMINPQFQQGGSFSSEAFKEYLRQAGMSEAEYISSIKRNIAKKIMLETQAEGVNVPQVALKQMEKVAGQRRTFKYAEIKYADILPDREPSDDELDQYYTDFSEEFIEPEKRDVKIMFLSLDNLADGIKVSKEDIEEYYKEHITDYEQPEKRNVLQMIFNSEDEAKKAYEKIQNGADFKEVATELGQKDIDLGFVSSDELMSELSDVAFALSKGETAAPFELNEEWQILKVTDIKAAQKADKQESERQIEKLLKQERAYEGSYELINEIEDKLGAGTDLETVAADYKTNLLEVKNVDENGNSDSRNLDVAALLENRDVIDAIFSYTEGETSQAIEDDNGIVVIEIEKIKEEHVMPKELVADKIRTLWLENEKASIMQEKIDNIEHDMETGDEFSEVASRYGLEVKRTMPVARSENFAELNAQEMVKLFTKPVDEMQVIKRGDDYVIALGDKIYDDSANLSEKEKSEIKNLLYKEEVNELSGALLKDFARNYKIEVNYSRMGIVD